MELPGSGKGYVRFHCCHMLLLSSLCLSFVVTPELGISRNAWQLFRESITMYVQKGRQGCELRLSSHAGKRIASRPGLTRKRIREAHMDSDGVIFKVGESRRALLARSDDGVYLTLILELRRSCDLLLTVREMDGKEEKRYRKG